MLPRNHHLLHQEPVQAEPHAYLVFLWLDVDIARAAGHRRKDDTVHEADDRRILRQTDQLVHREVALRPRRLTHLVENGERAMLYVEDAIYRLGEVGLES